MDVWLLVSMGWRARVKADMAEPIHYHTVHQVDRLPGPRKVHLGPVVLRGGGVGVPGGRGGGYSSVPESSFKYWSAEQARELVRNTIYMTYLTHYSMMARV